MSKPSPKQNIVQTLLLASVIWLGLMLFMRGGDTPKTKFDTVQASAQESVEKGTSIAAELDQLRTELLTDNDKVLDLTIVKHANSYTGLVNEAEKKNLLGKAEADQKRLEASIIVADTQRKAGVIRNDTTRIRNAYQTLKGQRHEFEGTPLWDETTFDLPEFKGVPSGDGTAHKLFEEIFTNLNARNHTEKVYGFIPGYEVVDFLVGITGRNPAFSYALACLILALLVRGVVYPLSERQLMFSRKMTQLAPLTNEIRKEYKDDHQTQQQKVMEVYREYGINPLAGCFPALLQMPLFLSVYQCMLHYQFEFTKGTFLWMTPAISKLTHGWTAPNLGETDYPLIVIYGVTMLISTLLAPISDPSQAKQQRLMTVGITATFMIGMFFYPLPCAFVLYWTFTNLLSMAQSLRAYRRKLPPLEKVNAAGGGVYPKQGVAGKWMQMMEDAQRQAAEAKTQNGAANGKPTGTQVIKNGEVKTGAPAKHKPKKRK
jgi:YidC/Oxa1 family membrane protein insertase